MTIESMRTLLVLVALVSCDGACGGHHDAPDAMPDAVTLDCQSYCDEIQTNCTGPNAQYLDMASCMATCASFSVGSEISDVPGNTLGCRIYHAGTPAMTMPAAHCPHAGPAGDRIMPGPTAVCSGMDVCESFCALEIKACGSVQAPLPGNPRDINGNPLFQYQNMANCMMTCAGYDKTHAYSTASAGDSLACRLLHATRAAIAVTPNAKDECASTGFFPTGPCAGTPTP